MNIIPSISPTVSDPEFSRFPSLEVDRQKKIKKDKLYLTNVWSVNNKIKPHEMYSINRIEVQQSLRGRVMLDIFLKELACEQMQKVFSGRTNAVFFHDHKDNLCKLQLRDPIDIKVLFTRIKEHHVIRENTKAEMRSLLAKL